MIEPTIAVPAGVEVFQVAITAFAGVAFLGMWNSHNKMKDTLVRLDTHLFGPKGDNGLTSRVKALEEKHQHLADRVNICQAAGCPADGLLHQRGAPE